ncbi:conserved protein of unknown function [Modestobacter italicus]|uniref:Capsular polysaccharide biosynthesis protein n=1 Tax=Modestobacter italicus (strain DSM 44449 / CECT 9708 / BC 501) TaxID=2732864 RepID=I4ER98_MODI5|nr:hypothetical protein [Modestobacter marinus]CCH85911.1 conserved protein of unknown function [Modestobacter marinus]
MDLMDVARGCLRRWYVLLLVVPLAAGVALHLGQGARATWSASATLVVVPSPELTAARDPAIGEDGPGDTNPFSSAATLALLVSRAVATDTVLTGLPSGASATASWDGLRPSLLLLAATGDDRSSAAEALEATVTAAQRSLSDLQRAQGVTAGAVFLAIPGSDADAPAITTPDRRRMTVVVVGAGGLAAVTIAVALDTALLRRRRERAAAALTDDRLTPALSGATRGGHR